MIRPVAIVSDAGLAKVSEPIFGLQLFGKQNFEYFYPARRILADSQKRRMIFAIFSDGSVSTLIFPGRFHAEIR
jgi:hypothetical protein